MALWTKTEFLNFPTIPSQGSVDLTIEVPGAELTDIVAVGTPGSLPNAIVAVGFVSAPGIVTVRLSRVSAGPPIDPVSGEFRVIGDR